jgi:hypothetical protein
LADFGSDKSQNRGQNPHQTDRFDFPYSYLKQRSTIPAAHWLAHIKTYNGHWSLSIPWHIPFPYTFNALQNNFTLKLASLLGLATFATAQAGFCPEALRFGTFQVSPSNLASGAVRKHILFPTA